MVVIGGGPSGLSAAAKASSEGLRTLVLESKERIGSPVQCGEVISNRALDYSGLGEGDWIVHQISRYRIISPSGGNVFSSTRGYCLDRELFDLELAEVAMSFGANISTSVKVTSCSKHVDGWHLTIKGHDLIARSVILATGPSSSLCKDLGLTENREIMRAIGAKVPRKDDSNVMDFYVKEELQSGYGWYFPRGNEVNIGVTCRDNVRYWFDHLLKRLGIDIDEIKSWHGGIIPDSGPIEKLVGDGVIAVGDAGGFCHPVSKGGIFCAMYTGREGAKAIIEFHEGDMVSLSRWGDRIRSHPAFSMDNVKRRNLLGEIDDRTLNDITAIMDGCDLQVADQKKIMMKAMTKPNLYSLILKGLTMVRNGREWMDYSF